MAKTYSKKTFASPKMNPKKETVSFILDFSKAFSIIKAGKMKIEILAN